MWGKAVVGGVGSVVGRGGVCVGPVDQQVNATDGYNVYPHRTKPTSFYDAITYATRQRAATTAAAKMRMTAREFIQRSAGRWREIGVVNAMSAMSNA